MRTLSLALLVTLVACGSPQAPDDDEAAAHHPATYEEAKALAAERNVPLLIDFFTPT